MRSKSPINRGIRARTLTKKWLVGAVVVTASSMPLACTHIIELPPKHHASSTTSGDGGEGGSSDGAGGSGPQTAVATTGAHAATTGAGLSCKGTPEACSDVDPYQGYCGIQGCTERSACGGTATPCDTLDETYCADQAGCDYSFSGGYCFGDADPCAQTPVVGCGEQQGCHLQSPCGGSNPKPCSSFDSKGDCDLQPGCGWE